MSKQNVEVVRSLYRAGDPSRFFDRLHEEVHVDASEGPLLPDYPALIRGKDAVLDFYRHYWGTWDDYVLEPAEVIDAGKDRVLVVHHEHGAGKGSGVPFERRWAMLYTLQAGQIVKLDLFTTRERALEAVGLSE
jgi:ketosteroid isomerase-like protein